MAAATQTAYLNNICVYSSSTFPFLKTSERTLSVSDDSSSSNANAAAEATPQVCLVFSWKGASWSQTGEAHRQELNQQRLYVMCNTKDESMDHLLVGVQILLEIWILDLNAYTITQFAIGVFYLAEAMFIAIW
ncbi:hypothetical protein FRX31_026411 [Thalictrum thalictroides]|uniref:Uncharacterized protein n=1 Tax=Thalictrum thalictroides TaxID=46969 RepID=A0A7J6VI73_THATH|nr:hypothetical protein FRX31_026411 [Thalictrum thalictroides]